MIVFSKADFEIGGLPGLSIFGQAKKVMEGGKNKCKKNKKKGFRKVFKNAIDYI